MLSVIVSTYNKPRHLRLSLEGLRHQSLEDFEVIVADDGSTADTGELVDRFAAEVPFRVEHVWQEDEGFRAARVRNLGVRAARGERIVFLDGDCIPFPDFLEQHQGAGGNPRDVLAGDRLFLDEQPTAALTVDDVSSGRYRDILPTSEYQQLRKRACKDTFYRLTRLKDRPKVVTANVSVSREALDAVNGLDERFVGWGQEDEDLRRRLVRRGYRIGSVTTTARVCHLWHPHVESFHGKVKYGDNIPYYRRGFFLSRCRIGLERRPMTDLDIAWSEPSRSAEIRDVAIGWGDRPVLGPADVRIEVIEGTAPPRSRSADLLVRTGIPDGDGLVIADRLPEVRTPGNYDLSKPGDRHRLLDLLDPVL